MTNFRQIYELTKPEKPVAFDALSKSSSCGWTCILSCKVCDLVHHITLKSVTRSQKGVSWKWTAEVGPMKYATNNTMEFAGTKKKYAFPMNHMRRVMQNIYAPCKTVRQTANKQQQQRRQQRQWIYKSARLSSVCVCAFAVLATNRLSVYCSAMILFAWNATHTAYIGRLIDGPIAWSVECSRGRGLARTKEPNCAECWLKTPETTYKHTLHVPSNFPFASNAIFFCFMRVCVSIVLTIRNGTATFK